MAQKPQRGRQAEAPPQREQMTLSERMYGHEAKDFNELLYEQTKNAPWLLASIGIHGVAFAIFALMPSAPPPPVQEQSNLTMNQTENLEMKEEEPPPTPEETKPLEESERVVEDPVLKDAKVSDHNETDDDMDDNGSLGDPRFNSDAPFEGPGTNGTIGIGGGAGGKFGNRRGGRNNLKAGGGGKKSQNAVDLALEWLKNHQSSDGRWDTDGFDQMCKLNKCSGPGEGTYDPGNSGLALLCFLGAGETHQNGTYKDTVRNGLKWLKDQQDAEGCFGPRSTQHFQYNHMCASLAMTEAYGLTQSPLFRESAQRGVNFVIQSQNPYLAWRYGVRDGDNDTSVTGWAVMALKSAIMAELEVDKTAFQGALTWTDRMTEPDFGRVGYQTRGTGPARTEAMKDKFPQSESEAMTAVGVLNRIFCHHSKGDEGDEIKKDEMIAKGGDLMLKKLPKWDADAGCIDFYYWYYGSLAMYQLGGKYWEAWKPAMEESIIKHQRTEPGRDEIGSWDPEDPWAPEGGRIYSTAVNCLCLEVFYRYGRVMGTGGAK
ncbi:MAG: hypothetical protein HMLKMBBP_01181 [Planctomycetes bacterium]|nr:hypothetical protein [Planctomycetota bacterium]